MITLDGVGCYQTIFGGSNDSALIFSNMSRVVLGGTSGIANVSGLSPSGNTISFFQPSLVDSPASVVDVVGAITAVVREQGRFQAEISFSQIGPANVGQLFAAVNTECCTNPVGGYACISNNVQSSIQQVAAGTMYSLLGVVAAAPLVLEESVQATISSSSATILINGSGFQSCDSSLSTVADCLGLTSVLLSCSTGPSYVFFSMNMSTRLYLVLTLMYSLFAFEWWRCCVQSGWDGCGSTRIWPRSGIFVSWKKAYDCHV